MPRSPSPSRYPPRRYRSPSPRRDYGGLRDRDRGGDRFRDDRDWRRDGRERDFRGGDRDRDRNWDTYYRRREDRSPPPSTSASASGPATGAAVPSRAGSPEEGQIPSPGKAPLRRRSPSPPRRRWSPSPPRRGYGDRPRGETFERRGWDRDRGADRDRERVRGDRWGGPARSRSPLSPPRRRDRSPSAASTRTPPSRYSPRRRERSASGSPPRRGGSGHGLSPEPRSVAAPVGQGSQQRVPSGPRSERPPPTGPRVFPGPAPLMGRPVVPTGTGASPAPSSDSGPSHSTGTTSTAAVGGPSRLSWSDRKSGVGTSPISSSTTPAPFQGSPAPAPVNPYGSAPTAMPPVAPTLAPTVPEPASAPPVITEAEQRAREEAKILSEMPPLKVPFIGAWEAELTAHQSRLAPLQQTIIRSQAGVRLAAAVLADADAERAAAKERRKICEGQLMLGGSLGFIGV